MQFNGRLDLKSTDLILKDRGLEDMGRVQKFIDSEVPRRMSPYMPMLSGYMADKAYKFGPPIGTGIVEYVGPYMRFQYYGKLMVSSITGSAWAKHGEMKVLTDIDLQHNKSKHPMAGPFAFDRMKADHKDDILNGARKLAGAK